MIKLINLSFLFLVLLIVKLCSCAEISDKRLCGDPECSIIIAKARTKLSSPISNKYILNFGSNVDVDVYSKSAGNKPEFWGVQIGKRRGYVHTRFITETKTITPEKDLIEVPTEIGLTAQNPGPVANKAPDTKAEQIQNVPAPVVENKDPINEIVKPDTPIMEMAPSENKLTGENVVTETNVKAQTVDKPELVVENGSIDKEDVEDDDDGDDDEDDGEDDEEDDENDSENNDEDNEDENIINIDDILVEEPIQKINDNIPNTIQPIPETVVVDSKNINVNQPDDLNLNTSEPQIQTNSAEEIISAEKNQPIPETVVVDNKNINVNQPDDLNLNASEPQIQINSAEEIISAEKNQPIPETVIVDNKNIDLIQTNQASTQNADVPNDIEKLKLVDNTEAAQLDEKPIENLNSPSNVVQEGEVNIEPKPVNVVDTNMVPEDSKNNDLPVIDDINIPTPESLSHVYDSSEIVSNNPTIVTQPPPIVVSVQSEDKTQVVDEVQEIVNVTEAINETSNSVLVEEQQKLTDIPIILNDTEPSYEYPKAIVEEITTNLVPEYIETTTIPFEYQTPDTPIVEEDTTTPSPIIEPNDQMSLQDILYPGQKANLNHNVPHPENNHDHNLPHHEHNVVDQLLSKPNLGENEYCDSLLPNSCLLQNGDKTNEVGSYPPALGNPHKDYLTQKSMNSTDDFIKLVMEQIIEFSNLILYLSITGFTLLIFTLGHYCISKCRKERPLVMKLNNLERSLMGLLKENSILKNDLIDTRNKLTSIEDNSFGSNDMVIALKSQLEDAERNKVELEEQIISLERELETAAEAGLELNKMVAELLNQNGSDSIALTVDELQKQLNEQQETIESMNETLAAKSRENSELQILLSKERNNLGGELEQQQQQIEDLLNEKESTLKELEDLKLSFESQQQTLTNVQKDCNIEISNLKKELNATQSRSEELQRSLRKSESKVHTLEECIRDMQKNSDGGKISNVIDLADLKAELLTVSKEKNIMKERLNGEMDARKLLEDHVKIVSEEVLSLKKEHNQAEKDKLEAQTRLEVLSTYFKEKETQLQKELSIKEAMTMQQRGETTSTVERIRLMQDEIQSLKSQNDSLRAEIEAQSVGYKAQTNALETRAHEAWISTRQAERKLEESRAEASALRRRLTTLAEMPGAMSTIIDGNMSNDLGVPSPIRVESPNSPQMMGGLPPYIPPPFMAVPPPFMPPPFMTNAGEMRPPPLGRLMSPPPNRYSPNNLDERDHRNSNRDRYSPNDRRRYSPADSRYDDDYSVMSPYEEETDFSPPPSPGPSRHRGGFKSFTQFSPPPPPASDSRNKKSKGGLSSGSQDSVGPRGKK